jgi:preprotein translocase subunit SecG
MATLLIIMVILLTHFKGNKLGLNLGGNKKDNIVLVGYL